MNKDSKSPSKRSRLRHVLVCVLLVAIWVPMFVFVLRLTMKYSMKPTRQTTAEKPRPRGKVKQNVGVQTDKDHKSIRLGFREQKGDPIHITGGIDTLRFWNSCDDTIELRFGFRGKSAEKMDHLFSFDRKKISLPPRANPSDGAGPKRTLSLTLRRDKLEDAELEGVQFWVFGGTDTARMPVVFAEGLLAERLSPEPPEKYKDLLWLPGDEYGALSEKDTLKIEEHKTYLIFKNLATERVERRLHFERAGRAFTDGLQLKPDRLVLSRKWSQDSVRLVLLSKAFFERPPRNVELVISDPKGRETLRIPLAFKPMLAATWADYVKFLYGGREIQEATTLPANPHQWQEIQVINDNLLGLSVTYQVAMDSQGVICLDGGQTEVDRNSAEKISWERKPTDLNRITFRFKVSSEKGVFDTTFVVSVSSGSLFADMGSFLSRNWLTVPLLLVIGAMGYLSLNLMGRIISLARRRGQHLRLLKERETEIMRMKLNLKKLEMENADLARRVGREVRYELNPSPGPLVTHENLVDKAREDLLQDINRLEFILNEKDAELRAKELELHEKDSQLEELKQGYSDSSEKLTLLDAALQKKEETIAENMQEIEALKSEVETRQRVPVASGNPKGELPNSPTLYKELYTENKQLKSQLEGSKAMPEGPARDEQRLREKNEKWFKEKSELKHQVKQLRSELERKNALLGEIKEKFTEL